MTDADQIAIRRWIYKTLRTLADIADILDAHQAELRVIIARLEELAAKIDAE